MGYRVSDMHLSNIGVAEHSDILVLDYETWKRCPEQDMQKKRARKGVTTFVEERYSL